MFLRPLVLTVFAVCIALSSIPAYGQGAGRRADVAEVAKAVSGDNKKYFGPTNLPRPPFTEDGRHLVYMDPVFVSAIRGRRPVRTYTFWPRLTMSDGADQSDFFSKRAHVRDAVMLALAQIAQIDWPGETMFDAALASRASKARIAGTLGDGNVDAIDFLFIDVQVF